MRLSLEQQVRLITADEVWQGGLVGGNFHSSRADCDTLYYVSMSPCHFFPQADKRKMPGQGALVSMFKRPSKFTMKCFCVDMLKNN